GITPGIITVYRDANDLILSLSSGDQITVDRWFTSNYYWIERFVFIDGTEWDFTHFQGVEFFVPGATDGDDTLTGWLGVDHIDGGLGDDQLRGGNGNDTLAGGADNDNLDGESGDDTLNGGDGDDVLYDNDGYNTFEGGAGDDTISGHGTFRGGSGNDTLSSTNIGRGDTYYFDLGDGQDRITDHGYHTSNITHFFTDSVIFGAGITPGIITVYRDANDLILSLSSGDQITVDRWFTSNYYWIERFVFIDGTVWTYDTINTEHSNDEIIRIFSGDEYANVVIGTGGVDIFTVTPGNDLLQGGNGSDVYHWSPTSGSDVIWDYGIADSVEDSLLIDGVVSAPELSISHNGLDLMILHASSGSSVRIQDWFLEASYQIESIAINGEFYDVAPYTSQFELVSGEVILSVGSQSSLLIGSDQDNRLISGTFDSVMSGGEGDDVYEWTGAANDHIDNHDALGSDTLEIDAAIAPTDITWSHQQFNLVATVVGSGNSLTLVDWFRGEDYALTSIKFLNDDSDLDITAMVQELTTLNDDLDVGLLTGSVLNEQLYGLDSDDDLFGEGGDDDLFGGLGNDTLYGGPGDDTYHWGEGQGNDVIDDLDNLSPLNAPVNDRLVIAAPLTADELTGSRENFDLVITITASGETLRVLNWFFGSAYQLESIELADGIYLTLADLFASEPLPLVASLDGSKVDGTSGSDVILGLSGNDTLNGGNGSDYLDGGAGDDT
ncbi:calcium-binding protein, partial [Marinagarivorans algicola]|uniref:calcium-binding protein n=1 Tax=Marinagarivorans algicola TaxID=1513270 RepID=UPI000A7941E9